MFGRGVPHRQFNIGGAEACRHWACRKVGRKSSPGIVELAGG
ncbi:hypothetical protein TIFTF001_050042, partial [Ficus carica]